MDRMDSVAFLKRLADLGCRKFRAKSTSTPAVRCAIYTRKSCEEGLELEFNSLHAQRESAEAFIKSQQNVGWVCNPEQYDEPATFDAGQKILKLHSPGKGNGLNNKYGALLKGLLYCSACKKAMVHTRSSRGSKRYRYYTYLKAIKCG